MAISKERRSELKESYVELLNDSRAVILTEFTKLPVKKLEALRGEVIKADGRFHVTKNTLLSLALAETGNPVPSEMLQGPTAVGFVIGEVPTVAKTFVDFAKAEDSFSIKGGILGNKILTAEQVVALATLPSLDQLRAQIIGLINGPSQGIVSAVANGVRQVINVVDAYAKQDQSTDEAEVAEAIEAAA